MMGEHFGHTGLSPRRLLRPDQAAGRRRAYEASAKGLEAGGVDLEHVDALEGTGTLERDGGVRP